VDFIPKELSYVSLDIVKIKEELVSKVKHIVLSRSLAMRLERIRASIHKTSAGGGPPPAPKKPIDVSVRGDLRAVVLAVSTGGPFALLKILPKLPKSYPLGIAIVQHMPPKFTLSLAERLDGLSQVAVKEAEEGEPMEPGKVIIAPGGQHLTFSGNGRTINAHIGLEPLNTLYRPSADIMMTSAVEAVSGPLLGVVMTGMGKDGLEGARSIKQHKGVVVAQDEESCVVYGMPKAVVDEGLVDYNPSLEDIPATLVKIVGGQL
jgi:two-component system chemotaxis response regulator CheB